MIKEYLHDALVGEDKESAAQLLQRKAPIKNCDLLFVLMGSYSKLPWLAQSRLSARI